ncbi:hypothetical protein GEOBRER4_n3171 [Citrifermentans bremense]|uniref:Uncharacterized protein n=1 Tax=Citrifermentans bremense TaxID=60035 RepID=A0A6S6M8W1_9BACT|nr:hypothetical protein [Citrifermentans bremense]BCG48286.1 hypothetical protein GEOBRER4_n3171 [Citrifermentans bremense]
MSDTENQMGLFETGEVLPEKPLDPPTPQAPPTHPEARPLPAAKTVEPPAAARSERAAQKPSRKKEQAKGAAKGAKAVSGLVPEGDVRLTANIRQDLHLKLKIASAYRRTTIGEIIEELVEKYV